MKKQFILIAILSLNSIMMFAQTSDADKLKIDKPKIISKLDNLALSQITVNYMLTTTAKTIGQEKSSGSMAGAKISAYLQTNDGELAETDFQEITDYFHVYFQRTLKANGIDTVAWNTISATEFYKNAAEKEDEGGKGKKDEKGGNTWVTTTAHKGNLMHGKELAFAFGKIKKASAFCKEIGAPAGFFYLTVDFADVLVNVEIETKREGVYYPTTIKKTKYIWGVDPVMSVGPSDLGYTLFWNEKDKGELLLQTGQIAGGVTYSHNMTEDVSKARSGLAKQFAFRKEFTPLVIETTKEKYKAAAKKTLEKYADAFVVKCKQIRKD